MANTSQPGRQHLHNSAAINQLNRRSEISCDSSGTFTRMCRLNLHSNWEEDIMKKLGYVVAAIGALAVALPTLASAETVVIKRDHHHGLYGARAEYGMHRDYGWHR